MALAALSDLDQFKTIPPVTGLNPNMRSFQAPLDNVSGALQAALSSAVHSLVVAMFQYSDSKLDVIIRQKLQAEHCYVQLTLDSTEAGTATEKGLLAQWQHDGIGNSIAVGRSEHGAFMHDKICIVDGLDVITGSTNWTASAETKQDNHLLILRDPVLAAELRARLDILHDAILKQMAVKAKAA